MYLKILFLDSSAILSWFLKDENNNMQDGGQIIMDIHNRQTSIQCSLNISKTVYDEALKILQRKLNRKKINIAKYNTSLSLLNDFLLIDKNQKDPEKMEQWRKALFIKYPKLEERINSQDSHILNEFFSYLEGFAGASHPILVSCDNLMNEIANLEKYKIFNPRKQTLEDL